MYMYMYSDACIHVHVFFSFEDSEEETTKKKKVKTTPSKKSVGNLKGGKSPAPVVKREIKSVADFFGPAPVQRSVSSRVTRSSNAEKRKSEVNGMCNTVYMYMSQNKISTLLPTCTFTKTLLYTCTCTHTLYIV